MLLLFVQRAAGAYYGSERDLIGVATWEVYEVPMLAQLTKPLVREYKAPDGGAVHQSGVILAKAYNC